jgi:hypothetical protein
MRGITFHGNAPFKNGIIRRMYAFLPGTFLYPDTARLSFLLIHSTLVVSGTTHAISQADDAPSDSTFFMSQSPHAVIHSTLVVSGMDQQESGTIPAVYLRPVFAS